MVGMYAMTLAYDTYYQSKFDNKRISSSEDIVETVMIIRTLAVTLSLKIASQPVCTTLKLKMMDHNTKFGNKVFVGIEDIIWTNIDILSLCCDLDLSCSNPIFHRTLWLMMLHHHTKFVNKMLHG